MKAVLLISLLVIFWGCTSTPVRELNYRAEMPNSHPTDKALVLAFSATLADETALTIVDQSKVTGKESIDGSFSVHLRPNGKEELYVIVMAHFPSNVLFLTVGGEIESRRAKTIAFAAQALIERKYPGSKLLAYTRYQGLFGP